jgi:diguanylate cyclase (GGDEF)-like protein
VEKIQVMPAAGIPPMCVLLVDDDVGSLLALKAIVEPLADVVAVRSGREALDAVDNHDFAAVLLDVGMPVLDGFETARLIKERARGRTLPIIFLTGRIGEEEVRRAYSVGAVDYLLKPFEPEILQAKVSVFVDLARLRVETALLAHRSLHDHLTDLPNRSLFRDRLDLALARLEREPAVVAVFFLDLDDFKAVNDRFGHAAGDCVLIEMAQRIRGSIRATDTAARFGGDEFLVLCDQLADAEAVDQLAGRVRQALAAPYEIEGERVDVGVSIGVSMTRDPQAHPEELIRSADIAMFDLKNPTARVGRGGAVG